MEKALGKIGWIGTGVMGKSMCRHLMKAGYKLMVFNRTKAKTEELVKEGAEYAEPAEIAKTVDILFTMVGYPRDLEAVVLGEQGILKAMKRGALFIDHTTSSPALAERIAKVVSTFIRIRKAKTSASAALMRPSVEETLALAMASWP
jgi:3-hydroxyisobutyrate dehydrogenase